jgi:hypothetical protein
VVMARVWSAISASRSWMRRARARRLAAVAAVSTSQVARWRSRPQAVTSWRVVKPRSRPRSGSGAATTRAWSCRWASAVAGRSGLGELVAAQGLTGGPGGVQRVGLGAVAAGGSLGPVQLHHSFGMGMQEPGQASTVAAGAFDRHTRWPGCWSANASSWR